MSNIESLWIDLSVATSQIIVIVEENVQPSHLLLLTFHFTKMYARRGMINAYLQILLNLQ